VCKRGFYHAILVIRAITDLEQSDIRTPTKGKGLLGYSSARISVKKNEIHVRELDCQIRRTSRTTWANWIRRRNHAEPIVVTQDSSNGDPALGKLDARVSLIFGGAGHRNDRSDVDPEFRADVALIPEVLTIAPAKGHGEPKH
jgi:hypothetical protein